MMIQKYTFGEIVINSMNYRKDLLILGDEIICPWIRDEGHRLSLSDVRKVAEYGPETFIIGTGFFGMMKVDEDLVDFFRETGCAVHVLNSGPATDKFNQESMHSKTAAAFHLTC